jgi:hypothetical protein
MVQGEAGERKVFALFQPLLSESHDAPQFFPLLQGLIGFINFVKGITEIY